MRGLYQLRGHIEDDKTHYEKRIKPLFEKLFDIKISIRDMPSTRVVGFQIWNDELVNFKKKLGLCTGKKYQIEIPKIFLKNKNLKRCIIREIFDTDGGIYLEKKNGKLYPRIYITTICENLSEQIMEIFSEFELHSTKYSQLYDKKFKRKRSYILTIRGKEMFHKFMKEIKPKNPKHIEKYPRFVNSQNL